MVSWQVQQAKTHLSEVIERAQHEGPQTITRHGKPRAVVLSTTDYEALTNGKKPEPNLIDFLLDTGPKFDDFEIVHDKSIGREIDLE